MQSVDYHGQDAVLRGWHLTTGVVEDDTGAEIEVQDYSLVIYEKHASVVDLFLALLKPMESLVFE